MNLYCYFGVAVNLFKSRPIYSIQLSLSPTISIYKPRSIFRLKKFPIRRFTLARNAICRFWYTADWFLASTCFVSTAPKTRRTNGALDAWTLSRASSSRHLAPSLSALSAAANKLPKDAKELIWVREISTHTSPIAIGKKHPRLPGEEDSAIAVF